jgi:1-aminocyclopropane-1-carboxylate deaminase/D-cysteine desulfhydrase-like pyridoxal-dependent ACC family enzyme
VKRDDLFALDPLAPIRGGKLRQCLTMLAGTSALRLISAGSIHSPQPAIVSYVAQYLGLPCIVLVGGKQETTSLALARRFGAEIVRCRSGRHSVLFATARKIAMTGDFIVPFGMRPPEPWRHFYQTCAVQAYNVPEHIRTIVIASGSGVTATIVAYGIWQQRCFGRRIALINVGPNRRGQILDTLQSISPECANWAIREDVFEVFPLNQHPGFRYELPVCFHIGRILLNPLYEGKAFDWFTRTIGFDANDTLFWITGPPIELSARRADVG